VYFSPGVEFLLETGAGKQRNSLNIIQNHQVEFRQAAEASEQDLFGKTSANLPFRKRRGTKKPNNKIETL